MKFGGVFIKLPGVGYFYLIIELFFYWKSRGISPWSHGTGPWFRLMSPWHSRSLSAVDSLICGSDFLKTKGYRQSNPSPPSTSGRLKSNPADGGGALVRRGGAMGGSLELRSRALWGTVTRGFWAKTTQGWWGPYAGWNMAGNGSKLGHGGDSPPPSTDDGERWLWRSFGFKKQLNTFLVASSCFFPMTDWLERRWGSGARWRLGFDSCISKFGEYRPLYIGLLVLNHRWQRS
jgi:hypothetical protein